VGWLLTAALGVMGFLLFRRMWGAGPPSTLVPPPDAGNTKAIGELLYTRYLFPFELTSLVLLAAIVGAIVIGQGRASGGSGR
jgi:NADH-quinone oxidoreductase subunit J